MKVRKLAKRHGMSSIIWRNNLPWYAPETRAAVLRSKQAIRNYKAMMKTVSQWHELMRIVDWEPVTVSVI